MIGYGNMIQVSLLCIITHILVFLFVSSLLFFINSLLLLFFYNKITYNKVNYSYRDSGPLPFLCRIILKRCLLTRKLNIMGHNF